MFFANKRKVFGPLFQIVIDYEYIEGELPGHTKPYIEEYEILAAQGVIVTNALLLMCKIRKFPSFLPLSIRQVPNRRKCACPSCLALPK